MSWFVPASLSRFVASAAHGTADGLHQPLEIVDKELALACVSGGCSRRLKSPRLLRNSRNEEIIGTAGPNMDGRTHIMYNSSNVQMKPHDAAMYQIFMYIQTQREFSILSSIKEFVWQ